MTPQTVSLEVAKKLKEAGWSKRTYFEYDCSGAQGGDYYSDPSPDYDFKQSYIRSKPPLKAPQLHEILEELPEYIKLWKQTNGQNYAIGFIKSEIIYNNNPHDAAALLWIWCVENGYIF